MLTTDFDDLTQAVARARSRREILTLGARLCIAGVAVSFGACGDDGDGGRTPIACGACDDCFSCSQVPGTDEIDCRACPEACPVEDHCSEANQQDSFWLVGDELRTLGFMTTPSRSQFLELRSSTGEVVETVLAVSFDHPADQLRTATLLYAQNQQPDSATALVSSGDRIEYRSLPR
jgi:hypothetical protein